MCVLPVAEDDPVGIFVRLELLLVLGRVGKDDKDEKDDKDGLPLARVVGGLDGA